MKLVTFYSKLKDHYNLNEFVESIWNHTKKEKTILQYIEKMCVIKFKKEKLENYQVSKKWLNSLCVIEYFVAYANRNN